VFGIVISYGSRKNDSRARLSADRSHSCYH
jgi:hypothetical protein